MSIERVREYLKQFQADQNILEFPVSSATVELAAQAANCEPARHRQNVIILWSERLPIGCRCRRCQN